MKKILSTLCMTLVAAVMFAQAPVITFDEMAKEVGKVNVADGKIKVVFTFKNEGMTPLLLDTVIPQCGCSKPVIYTKQPVEPGQTGTIQVTFNPSGYEGKSFTKYVTVHSNATTPSVRLKFHGEGLPKQAQPSDKYVMKVGALSMSTKVLDLGTIQKGDVKGGELEYANLSAAAHQVDLTTSAADAFLAYQVSLPNPQPKEIGKFIIVLDTKKAKVYGPVEAKAYVVVDGKKELSDAFALTVKANVVEDFSQLTIEEKQNAPIIEVSKHMDLGKVAAGKSHRFILPILNVGVNPLEIRRVLCIDPALTVKAPKSIKSGKKGPITIDINAKNLEPGVYSREIMIINNDYKRSIQRVIVNFTVE